MARSLEGPAMNWVYDDGGRKAAGFRGKAGDCVTRSIAIATRLPYSDIWPNEDPDLEERLELLQIH